MPLSKAFRAHPLCRPLLLPLAWILVLAASPASPDSGSGAASAPASATSAAVPMAARALEPEAQARTEGGAAGAAGSGLAAVPWKIGEYYQFSIDWNGLNGGNSLMQVHSQHRIGRCFEQSALFGFAHCRAIQCIGAFGNGGSEQERRGIQRQH